MFPPLSSQKTDAPHLTLKPTTYPAFPMEWQLTPTETFGLLCSMEAKWVNPVFYEPSSCQPLRSTYQQVIQVDPRKGKKLGQIDFPTKNMTSVAFGGPDLDVLYATSAEHFLSKEELKEQPGAGCLFEVRGLGVKGAGAGEEFKGMV